MTKRGAQVMRHRVAEGFQLFIGGLKQLATALQLRSYTAALSDVVMDQKVYGGQEDQMQKCAESKQGDRISSAFSRLCDASLKCSLFGHIEFRHETIDCFDLVFCRS